MKRKLGKKLVLNRETVSELTESQLDWVNGGHHTLPHLCIKTVSPPCRSGVGGSITDFSCICPTCGPSCRYTPCC